MQGFFLFSFFISISNYFKLIYFIYFILFFSYRCETIKSKISFKKLINNQRCVVFLNGYYEWKLVQGKKQPYFVTTRSQTPLKVAALYNIFQDNSSDELLYSFTILTCPADNSLNWLHERQPVFLSDDQIDDWISINQPLDTARFPFMEQINEEKENGEEKESGELEREDMEEVEDFEEHSENILSQNISSSSSNPSTLSNSNSHRYCYIPSDIISYTVTPSMTSLAYQQDDSSQPYTPILSRTITSFFNNKPPKKNIETTTSISETIETTTSSTNNETIDSGINSPFQSSEETKEREIVVVDLVDDDDNENERDDHYSSDGNNNNNFNNNKNSKKRVGQGNMTDYFTTKSNKKNKKE